MAPSAPFSDVRWPTIQSGYADQFGPIDLRVYEEAGRIWPAARRLALRMLDDEASGLSLLSRASAIVTRVLGHAPDSIAQPGAYLWRTYARLVMAERELADRHRQIEERAASSDRDDSFRAIDRRQLSGSKPAVGHPAPTDIIVYPRLGDRHVRVASSSE